MRVEASLACRACLRRAGSGESCAVPSCSGLQQPRAALLDLCLSNLTSYHRSAPPPYEIPNYLPSVSKPRDRLTNPF